MHRHTHGGLGVYTQTTSSTGIETKLTTILKDHLGSTDLLYTGIWNGSSFANPQTEKQAFDPWGERRNAETWQNERTTSTDAYHTSGQGYDCGYTGHEQLDDSKLVHINGRIYDPELGRMLSPDPVVQVPEYSQNFNRYSYVMNNPMNMTDPSGFSWLRNVFHKLGSWLKDNWQTVVVIVVMAVIVIASCGTLTGAAALGGALLGATVSAAVGTIATAAIVGAFLGGIAGGLSAALTGGNLGDVLRVATIGGISGALTAGLAASPVGGTPLEVAGQGVIGGASNEAMGGKFQDGFMSAAAASAIQQVPYANSGVAGLVKSCVVGGTASSLGGGKFANGAYTAAFQYLVTVRTENVEKSFDNDVSQGLNALSRSPLGYLWNLPNTVVGLVLGGLGFASEAVTFPITGKWDFAINFDHNTIEFTGHNLVGTAITSGNKISYDSEFKPDCYRPGDFMKRYRGEIHTVWQHEIQHTDQGQIVGTLYLPLAISGMALDFVISGPSSGFHGKWIFMETGPMMHGSSNRPFPFFKSN